MQQQQHIQQAIIDNERKGIDLNPSDLVLFCFFDFVCFIFSFFNLFFSVFHRSRSWHLFSNLGLLRLLVGCQWVSEPILSPLLNKLKHTMGGFNLPQI